MKVIVLTVNGKKLEYEINETETVLSLKEKIGKEQALTPEKIRLFYVGLTRAREKMIVVTSLKYSEEPFNELVKMKYRSFRDILNSIYSVIEPYIINVEVTIDKNYKDIVNKDINEYLLDVDDTIIDRNINIEYKIMENSKFSKSIKEVISKEEQKNIDLGLKIHSILENIDFHNPNYNNIDKNYLPFIKSFLESEIMKNLDCNIYKEYEFKYEVDNTIYHGFIDLMLEYDDYINIIDYKLKYITSKEYIKQLNGYKDYIESITNKKVYTYLYSIIDRKIVSLIDNE